MSSQHDDLDAVKKVVDALEPFQSEERERIIRWACEKLGVSGQRSVGTHPDRQREEKDGERRDAPAGGSAARGTDIRTFVNEKKPDSDIQFATTVAYFYAFESPEAERKLSISSDDLQNACRYIGRERLNNPGQTLRNACYQGLLDKAEEKGAYKVNTVGENLVAVTLPNDAGGPAKPKRKKVPTKKKKVSIPKKAAKKKSQNK